MPGQVACYYSQVTPRAPLAGFAVVGDVDAVRQPYPLRLRPPGARPWWAMSESEQRPDPRAWLSERVAIVFPGQGSQFVGMGKTLSEVSEAARRVFEQADAALGLPLSQLCFGGP